MCQAPVDQTVVPRPFQHVAKGGHEHVARGGREIRALAGQVFDVQLPVACRQLSHVALTEVPYQAPIVVVQEEAAGADVVGIAFARCCQLTPFLDKPAGIGFEAELLRGRGVTSTDLECQFFGHPPRFNPAGLFGRADCVALSPGIEDAGEVEGAGIGLIECQATSKLDDRTSETVR